MGFMHDYLFALLVFGSSTMMMLPSMKPIADVLGIFGFMIWIVAFCTMQSLLLGLCIVLKERDEYLREARDI